MAKYSTKESGVCQKEGCSQCSGSGNTSTIAQKIGLVVVGVKGIWQNTHTYKTLNVRRPNITGYYRLPGKPAQASRRRCVARQLRARLVWLASQRHRGRHVTCNNTRGFEFSDIRLGLQWSELLVIDGPVEGSLIRPSRDQQYGWPAVVVRGPTGITKQSQPGTKQTNHLQIGKII